MSETLFKKIATAAIGALMLPFAAQASTVSQSLDFGPTDFGTLSFDPFDTALGTFSSASIVVSGNTDLAEGSITGETADIGFGRYDFSVFIDGEITMGGDFIGFASFLGPLTSCTMSVAGEQCAASYAATSDSFLLSDTSNQASRFVANIPRINVDVLTSPFTVRGFPLTPPTTDWTLTGTATLTYTFENDVAVVPLPAGLPLALGGLAMLGGLRLCRRARG